MKYKVLACLSVFILACSLTQALAEVPETTDNSFSHDVLKANKPVLVDFYAVWCGPCKRLAPVVDELAEKYKGRVKVLRVDIDANPKLAKQYGVRAIPTLITYKNGEQVDSSVGLVSKDSIENRIQKLLGAQ